MSDYVSKMAIRYKFPKTTSEEEINNKWGNYGVYDKNKLKDIYKLDNDIFHDGGYDYLEDKYEHYLDIVLKETYGTISGDFGSSRKLFKEELNEYLPTFKKVIPTIKASDLRYVYYCYYNGVDSPSCYEEGEWDDD